MVFPGHYFPISLGWCLAEDFERLKHLPSECTCERARLTVFRQSFVFYGQPRIGNMEKRHNKICLLGYDAFIALSQISMKPFISQSSLFLLFY